VGDAGSSCEVIATKAGDDDYNSVASVATSITSAKATQAALTVTSTSATYGQTLASFTSGGSGSGSVVVVWLRVWWFLGTGYSSMWRWLRVAPSAAVAKN
jgi:hypothetical protein